MLRECMKSAKQNLLSLKFIVIFIMCMCVYFFPFILYDEYEQLIKIYCLLASEAVSSTPLIVCRCWIDSMCVCNEQDFIRKKGFLHDIYW